MFIDVKIYDPFFVLFTFKFCHLTENQSIMRVNNWQFMCITVVSIGLAEFARKKRKKKHKNKTVYLGHTVMQNKHKHDRLSHCDKHLNFNESHFKNCYCASFWCFNIPPKVPNSADGRWLFVLSRPIHCRAHILLSGCIMACLPLMHGLKRYSKPTRTTYVGRILLTYLSDSGNYWQKLLFPVIFMLLVFCV